MTIMRAWNASRALQERHLQPAPRQLLLQRGREWRGLLQLAPVPLLQMRWLHWCPHPCWLHDHGVPAWLPLQVQVQRQRRQRQQQLALLLTTTTQQRPPPAAA